jgi:hypothetical protein
MNLLHETFTTLQARLRGTPFEIESTIRTLIDVYLFKRPLTNPYIRGDRESGSDDDSTVDVSDRTEVYDPDWGCQYQLHKGFCLKRTVIGNQFCDAHRDHYGLVPYNPQGPHSDPYFSIHIPYVRHHVFTGHYWYPRLLLAAFPTEDGMVVIGRLLGNRWIKALSRRDVKRCHNVGLLYKVLPQAALHRFYELTNIHEIGGEGYTSFEQMRVERPSLFRKYWLVWNRHLQDRKELLEWEGRSESDWFDHHRCYTRPNWEQYKKHYRLRGLQNTLRPPPPDEVDMWEHCEGEYPPMYADYPSPMSMRFRPYNKTTWAIQEKDTRTPRRTKHYAWDPDAWIAHVEGGHEWMEIVS